MADEMTLEQLEAKARKLPLMDRLRIARERCKLKGDISERDRVFIRTTLYDAGVALMKALDPTNEG